MKKKFISTAIVVLLVVALAATVLVGCTFVKANEERESKQILQTVSKYGYTLTTTQSEMIDYINSNASGLIQNYSFTVEEAIRYLSDRKAETKLLTIEGIQYLTTVANLNDKRKNALMSGTGSKWDGVLTWGEYYGAIKSVNDSFMSTVETSITASEAEAKKKEVNKASAKDVEKIEFVEGTVKDEYLKGDELDKDLLRIRIVYLKGADKADVTIPVTDAMFTTAFDSSTVGDKTMVVSFTVNNNEKNDDGEWEYQAVDLTAEWKYEVKKAPTTRTKDADEKDDTVVARYGTAAEIVEGYRSDDFDFTDRYLTTFFKDGLPVKIDLAEKIASSADYEKTAYRTLQSNLKSAYRDVGYYYESALENQVLSSLQWELQQAALALKDDAYWADEVTAQFDYLVAGSAVSYAAMSRKEQKDAFITAIGSALTSVYYIPKVYDKSDNENLQDYAWVSQILFGFTDEQKKKLGSDPTDAAYRNMMKHMTVDEANPQYEPNHEHDDNCVDGCNKDVAYLAYARSVFNDEVDDKGNIVKLSVYSELLLALDGAVTKKEDPLKVFEDFLYRFNSDDGIFNNDLGYLITPEGETTSWVDSFAKLGRNLVADSKDSNSMPTVGYYQNHEKGKKTVTLTDGTVKEVPEVAYAFSEYGVHLMMVKFTPFNAVMLNRDKYAVGDGYRLDVTSQLTDKNRETGKEKDTTFFKTLKDNVKTEIETAAYNDFIKKYITDENKESSETKIEVVEKKLNALVKKYTNG